ncbi:hypothetical protein HK104_010526 [Borealophlyctis nickersoniae]|nr:hypothetical protein HK104_010526 [Borealophlyctis nickersoniae]
MPAQTKPQTLVGTKIPRGVYRVRSEDKKGGAGVVREVSTDETFKGKKVVVVGVVGCFVDVDTKLVSEYANKFGEFKDKGVESIVVVVVNDPDATAAWAKSLNITQDVQILSDGDADVIGKLKLTQKVPGYGVRAIRHAMFVEDGVVRAVEAEEGGLEECTRTQPSNFLKTIETSRPAETKKRGRSIPTKPKKGAKKDQPEAEQEKEEEEGEEEEEKEKETKTKKQKKSEGGKAPAARRAKKGGAAKGKNAGKRGGEEEEEGGNEEEREGGDGEEDVLPDLPDDDELQDETYEETEKDPDHPHEADDDDYEPAETVPPSPVELEEGEEEEEEAAPQRAKTGAQSTKRKPNARKGGKGRGNKAK